MDRLHLFPDTTCIKNEKLVIAGCDLSTLADEYGTPLYVYDRVTLETATSIYQRTLKSSYPGKANITYASKAFLCLAMAQWVQKHNLWIDCTGSGELTIAVRAGVSREHILVHGVNKSPDDLEAAVQYAGTIVVDNPTELDRLSHLSHKFSLPSLWLRFRPGNTVDSHAYTQTGQVDSKFGMAWDEILHAGKLCREHDLPLRGIHFHQGSHFRDPSPLGFGIERSLDLAQELSLGEVWSLCPGGGWGVAYHEDDLPQPSIKLYVRFITENVITKCKTRGLPLPRLHLEPGRSIAARAGVAIYRVGAIKQTINRTWLLIDGGMADNPRHALYGSHYSALPIRQPERNNTERVWIAGPYCESSDVLIENLPFPKIETGELIAVPTSGAYHLSMASNYNGALRPTVLWLQNSRARVIQEREKLENLFCRDLGID